MNHEKILEVQQKLLTSLNVNENYLINPPKFTVAPLAPTLPANYMIAEDDIQINSQQRQYHWAPLILHEMMHSTGADGRIGRIKKLQDKYGYRRAKDSLFSESYCYEEYVAEIAQAMLEEHLGIWTSLQRTRFRDSLIKLYGARHNVLPFDLAVEAAKYYFDINIIPAGKVVREYLLFYNFKVR